MKKQKHFNSSRNLKTWQMRLIVAATCPKCRQFIHISDSITDENEVTSVGLCTRCGKAYFVRRTRSMPRQYIGGEEHAA